MDLILRSGKAEMGLYRRIIPEFSERMIAQKVTAKGRGRTATTVPTPTRRATT